MSTKETIHRLPPFSHAAEQAVLGCCLLNPKECIGECVETMRMGQEVFYDFRHQTLFQTLVNMFDGGVAPIDLVTVHQWLKDGGKLEAAGGLGYIVALPDAPISAANLSYYIGTVVDKWIRRKLIQTCTAGVTRVFDDNGGTTAELLDETERDVLAIGQSTARAGTATTRELVHRAIAKMEEYWENKGKLTGISTGFSDFDKFTTGLHDGEMIVIAARPAKGKTSLAMNIAEHVALVEKLPVGVFSLEMSGEQLIMRIISSNARVNIRHLIDGFGVERDAPKMTGSAGRIAGSVLHIDDTPGLSILELRTRARRMKQQHGIRLFVIDYMQLLHSTSRRADNRQQELTDISGGIKALAKELSVPIIVLSQLNREVERRGAGARPQLADLRESGAIEQDADVVGFLYEPASETQNDDYDETAEVIAVDFYIAKQRNGPLATVHLTFLKMLTRFESAAKVDTKDVEDAVAQQKRSPYND